MGEDARGAVAMGQLIVWDTGEAVAEFADVVSGARIPRVLNVPDGASVAVVLAELLGEVEAALA
ncbi:hypothetical protein [Streptodolium elevatio]|uniref:Uncharacterized protein n=1 Tax=Streptodolium elevatio TaxID=3157996 RepID=A0ABV3D8Q6_9ACTN